MKAFKMFYVLFERRGSMNKKIYQYIISILTMYPNFSKPIRTQVPYPAVPVLVRQ